MPIARSSMTYTVDLLKLNAKLKSRLLGPRGSIGGPAMRYFSRGELFYGTYVNCNCQRSI